MNSRAFGNHESYDQVGEMLILSITSILHVCNPRRLWIDCADEPSLQVPISLEHAHLLHCSLEVSS